MSGNKLKQTVMFQVINRTNVCLIKVEFTSCAISCCHLELKAGEQIKSVTLGEKPDGKVLTVAPPSLGKKKKKEGKKTNK